MSDDPFEAKDFEPSAAVEGRDAAPKPEVCPVHGIAMNDFDGVRVCPRIDCVAGEAEPRPSVATPECCAECATEGCDGTAKYCCCHGLSAPSDTAPTDEDAIKQLAACPKLWAGELDPRSSAYDVALDREEFGDYRKQLEEAQRDQDAFNRQNLELLRRAEAAEEQVRKLRDALNDVRDLLALQKETFLREKIEAVPMTSRSSERPNDIRGITLAAQEIANHVQAHAMKNGYSDWDCREYARLIAEHIGDTWIPVSTPPEREGRYLIVYRQGRIRRPFIGDYIPSEGWSGVIEGMEITHWQEIDELPVAPEEGKRD
jgi:hypothetical protein